MGKKTTKKNPIGMTNTTVMEAQKDISRHSRELDDKLRKKHRRGD